MKEKILNKANEMFLTYGFKSVTMDDISKDLGISKKTIYTHFSNKTDLINETTLFMHENIECGINEICEQNLNAIEELFEVKRFVLEKLKNEESSPFYQLQKFFPEIHQNLKTKQLAAVNDCIVRNIEKGIASGSYRNNIDIQFISRMYYVGIVGIKDEEIFPKQSFKQTELMELVLDYHIRAIATNKGLEILNTITNNQIK
ncbi:TetR/AcrR family transcriptional regulator [Wenyingzhuangia sp. IMCC45574]